MVKTVEIEGDADKIPLHKPLSVVGGDESKEGGSPIEISFEDIEKLEHVLIDIPVTETEYFDAEEESAIYWLAKGDLQDVDEFKIYYGAKHSWAEWFDDLFIDGDTGYDDNTVMVRHMVDSYEP